MLKLLWVAIFLLVVFLEDSRDPTPTAAEVTDNLPHELHDCSVSEVNVPHHDRILVIRCTQSDVTVFDGATLTQTSSVER